MVGLKLIHISKKAQVSSWVHGFGRLQAKIQISGIQTAIFV